jgi:hypothetical protein
MRGMRHSGRFLATAMPVDVVESYSPRATEKQVDQDVEKVVLQHCELVNGREGNPAPGGTRDDWSPGRVQGSVAYSPLHAAVRTVQHRCSFFAREACRQHRRSDSEHGGRGLPAADALLLHTLRVTPPVVWQ